MRRLSQSKQGVEPNIYHFVMDIAWFGLALATTTRFLSVYAIHIGATASQLTWMTALPALVMLIGSTLSGWWRARYADSYHAMLWPAIGFRLSFFLLALTPLLPVGFQPEWLIAVLTITAIPQGISGVIFLGLMRESISLERWAILNSRRHMALNATIAIGVLLAGVWLEHVIFPLNYQIMFLGGFLATLISFWHVTRVKPFFVTPVVRVSAFKRDLWRLPGLKNLVRIIVLTHIPFFMVYPFVPLQLVEGLGAEESFIAVFGLVELVGGLLVAIVAVRWITYRGNLTVIGYAMMGTALGIGLVGLAPELWFTLPAALLLGGSWTLVGIGIINMIADSSQPEQVAAYNLVFIQSVGLTTFVGPLLGNFLVNSALNLGLVLVIGAVVRGLAGWLITSRKEQDAETHMVVPEMTK